MSRLIEPSRKILVWDPLVRVFHWGLAASIGVAWLTSDHPKGLHQWAGYMAGVLIAIRLAWGLLGPGHARFASFVRGPRATLIYLRELLQGTERRHIGHNPAGGAMVVALIATIAAQVTVGWLQTTDALWGVEWIELLHAALARQILVLVALHLIGVLIASLRHRENLPLAMITGQKRSAEGDDVA